MTFGFAAKLCGEWARISLWTFFSDVRVENSQYANTDQQPLIFAATHHNMLVDPAIVCQAYSKEHLHYWAKNTVFINNYATRLLDSVGCVPVDRNSKDHATLYKATFDVFDEKESIVVFPEGTSHTLPHLGKLRDGASFVALEYAKSLRDTPRLNKNGSEPKPAAILPVGITYTDKANFRSQVIVRYGKPIQVTEFLDDYYKEPKATAKKVMKILEDSLLSLTINSPDWPNCHSATMAREMLFPGDYGNMPDFIEVTQRLIDIFVQDKDKKSLADNLYAYKAELDDLGLRDSDLAVYDGRSKRQLIPRQIAKDFMKKTLYMLADMPLFLPVLLVHLPMYIVSCQYSKSELYEEVKAQDKILSATLAFPFIYFLLFLWEWYYIYRFTFTGFFFSVATLFIFFWLHFVSIDRRLEAYKQWRGKFKLFDAFVLGRGNWTRKQRTLDIFKIRQNIQKELEDIFINNSDINDNDNISYVSKAIYARKYK